MKKHIRNLIIITLCMAGTLSAQNLIKNGDFEKGTAHWSLFAPGDAKANAANFAVKPEGVHGGANAAVLTSTGAARYGIVNYVRGHRFAPDQKYRVTAWVRAGADFVPEAGTPGYLIRVTMYSTASGWDSATDGLIYLAADKMVRSKDTSSFVGQSVPTEWTKVEGVFVGSPDTAKMNISVFVWKGTGTFYVDDVSIELVNETAPASTTEKPQSPAAPAAK